MLLFIRFFPIAGFPFDDGIGSDGFYATVFLLKSPTGGLIIALELIVGRYIVTI